MTRDMLAGTTNVEYFEEIGYCVDGSKTMPSRYLKTYPMKGRTFRNVAEVIAAEQSLNDLLKR